ncbi:hypothetical protein MTR_3g081660 [Medicago truncatula]|uniref:Uncharacterized protein n=1 Tax=Medicago truncatula TaxID=3880 RepID=A0A072V068_MEDTR|nr:hypothetical protein MTR_3g081660 [Medicago truncatula]
MAYKNIPVNGNLVQNSGKQGLLSALIASHSMWTQPFAKITPSAKAFMATKRFPFVLRVEYCFSCEILEQ